MVRCSSDIIFGSCCDGEFWLFQVKCVTFAPILENSEAGNHHHQVLQLEPLEVGRHRQSVLVMGSSVLLPVLVIPIIMLFISLVKLWITFLYTVETLIIVASG